VIFPSIAAGRSPTPAPGSGRRGRRLLGGRHHLQLRDISGTGTSVPLTDDSVARSRSGSRLITTEGRTRASTYRRTGSCRDADYGSGCCTGQPLPDTFTPNGVIAGWWRSEPVVGRYDSVSDVGDGAQSACDSSVHERAALLDRQQCDDAVQALRDHRGHRGPLSGGAVGWRHPLGGIENQDGTVGLQYYLGTAALTTPLAVRYTPPPRSRRRTPTPQRSTSPTRTSPSTRPPWSAPRCRTSDHPAARHRQRRHRRPGVDLEEARRSRFRPATASSPWQGGPVLSARP